MARRGVDTAALAVKKRASVAQLLFKCARLVNERAMARVNARTGGRVLKAAYTALFPHLDFVGVPVASLAHKLGISKQAVSQTLAELARQGIVELVADPDDGRRVWAGTWGEGVFVSGDGGASWADFGLQRIQVRSMAIDPTITPYGTPIWIDTKRPVARKPGATEPYRRLMISQDTGAAIKGPARGDVYFGSGTQAADWAGRMVGEVPWLWLMPEGERLGGVEAPKFEDNEASLADLRERIRKTLEFIRSVPADAIDGTESKDITVPRRDGNITMKGEAYLKNYVLPNFFFHVTTAYALLRHNGVELGKGDYLGSLT